MRRRRRLGQKHGWRPMIAVATAILISQGYTPNSADDLDRRALLLVTACTAPGPRADPTGAECIAALSAIWATETAGTWSIYPPRNGTGVGPAQVVQPRGCFRNTRIKTVCAPQHELIDPAGSLRWGLWVLRLKRARGGSWRRTFSRYNAHPLHRDAYARRALALFRHAGDTLYNGSSNADNYAASALRRFYR